MDIPIAGPQRAERLGWTGDGQLITALSCRNMFDTVRFFSKWLDDFSADQRQDGQVGTMIPYVSFSEEQGGEDDVSASAAWGDAAVIVPYELYRFYGERSLLERYAGAARKYVEFMRRSGEDECLFDQGFCFGDWFALDNGEDAYPGKTDKAMVACFYYYRSTVLLAAMLRELGETEDALAYERLARRIRTAVNARFFTGDGLLDMATQTGCAMALRFGIAEKPDIVARQLVGMIRAKGYLDTGFIGTSIVLHALCEIGEQGLAYDMLLRREYPSWLYQVANGATTIWEHWNGRKPDGSFWSPNMNSFCHLTFGSVGDWLYERVLGLRPEEGAYGFSRFVFAPATDRRLGFAKGGFRCMQGEISAGWRYDGGELELTLEVPVGAEARAILPGAGAGGANLEAVCSSGRHSFRYAAK
jgi:alpha-L-rhamnosidase